MEEARALFYYYLDGVANRRWTALLFCCLAAVIGWVVVACIPDRFSATAKIYVDTDNLLQPLLKGLAVQPDANQQIQLMYRTLLTRPNLEEVSRKADLDHDWTDAVTAERALDRLRERISIRPEATPNLFLISYTDADAARARTVVQILVTRFVESNLGNKRRDMDSAQRFLDDRLREYEEQLRASEAKLSDFRKSNADLLDGGGNVVARLERAREAMTTAKRDLESARIKRDTLRAQLAQVPEVVDADGAQQVFITNGVAELDTSEAAVLERRLAELRKNRSALMLRYTAQHPDVVKIDRMIEELRGQLAAEKASPTVTDDKPAEPRRPRASQRSPIFEQLRVRLAEQEGELALAESRARQQQVELERLIQMAGFAPDVDAKFADLNRDYLVIKKNYSELLERRESARLAQAVDNQRESFQFRIVEPPFVPATPSFPNRQLFSAGVFAAAIAFGIAATAGLVSLQDRFHSTDHLQRLFDTQLLGTITMLEQPKSSLQILAGLTPFLLSCAALVATFALVAFLQPQARHLGQWASSLTTLVQRFL